LKTRATVSPTLEMATGQPRFGQRQFQEKKTAPAEIPPGRFDELCVLNREPYSVA